MRGQDDLSSGGAGHRGGGGPAAGIPAAGCTFGGLVVPGRARGWLGSLDQRATWSRAGLRRRHPRPPPPTDIRGRLRPQPPPTDRTARPPQPRTPPPSTPAPAPCPGRGYPAPGVLGPHTTLPNITAPASHDPLATLGQAPAARSRDRPPHRRRSGNKPACRSPGLHASVASRRVAGPASGERRTGDPRPGADGGV